MKKTFTSPYALATWLNNNQELNELQREQLMYKAVREKLFRGLYLVTINPN